MSGRTTCKQSAQSMVFFERSVTDHFLMRLMRKKEIQETERERKKPNGQTVK
jgi:hypothetical protein